MKATIKGIAVEGSATEIAELINKVSDNDNKDKFFDAAKVSEKSFKKDDPYSEHRSIIYTNQNSDLFDQATVKFEIISGAEKFFNEISNLTKGRGIKYY
jgi:hypothetical protein